MNCFNLIAMFMLIGCSQATTEVVVFGLGGNTTSFVSNNSDKIYSAMPKILQDKIANHQDKKNRKICFNYFENLDQFKKSKGLATFCEKYKEGYDKRNDE